MSGDRVDVSCFGTVLRADGGHRSFQHLTSLPSWRLGFEHVPGRMPYESDNSEVPPPICTLLLFLTLIGQRAFRGKKEEYYRLSPHYTHTHTALVHPPHPLCRLWVPHGHGSCLLCLYPWYTAHCLAPKALKTCSRDGWRPLSASQQ